MAIHLSCSTGIRINSRRRESRNPRGMFARGRARGGNVGMPDVSLRSRAPFLAATVTYRDCCAGIPANVVPLPLLASKKFQANKDYPRIALTSVSRRINYPRLIKAPTLINTLEKMPWNYGYMALFTCIFL